MAKNLERQADEFCKTFGFSKNNTKLQYADI